jgi:hypothetical protein
MPGSDASNRRRETLTEIIGRFPRLIIDHWLRIT